jgi:hypothetical protein
MLPLFEAEVVLEHFRMLPEKRHYLLRFFAGAIFLKKSLYKFFCHPERFILFVGYKFSANANGYRQRAKSTSHILRVASGNTTETKKFL